MQQSIEPPSVILVTQLSFAHSGNCYAVLKWDCQCKGEDVFQKPLEPVIGITHPCLYQDQQNTDQCSSGLFCDESTELNL